MTENALVEHFRAMARNNAWSNDRLYAACRTLSPAAFAAERVSFFPSLVETLNHILTVDWYYLDALEDGGLGHHRVSWSSGTRLRGVESERSPPAVTPP